MRRRLRPNEKSEGVISPTYRQEGAKGRRRTGAGRAGLVGCGLGHRQSGRVRRSRRMVQPYVRRRPRAQPPRRDRSGSFANEPAGKALAGTDGAVAMAADLQAVKGRTNGLRADSCITLRQHKICIRRSAELTRIKRRPLDVPCGRTQDDSRRRPQGRAEPFKSARRWDSPCRTPAPLRLPHL